MTPSTVTLKAIKRAGGAAAVARKLNITISAVMQWARVPEQHVEKLALMSGIPCHKLRPDTRKRRECCLAK